jgi:type II secretory pathway pseudopilin PulG
MVEILIAVALIAILAGGIFFVGGRSAESSKIRLTESAITILDTALEQYYDFDKAYPPDVNYALPGIPPASRSLPYAFEPIGGAAVLSMQPSNPLYTLDYYEAQSIEVAYYYLNRIPQSRVILGKLPESAVSAKAVKLENGYPLPSKPTDPNVVINITNVGDVGLFRVVDAWHMPLEYSRYRVDIAVENTNFPLIRSAGPDRKFGTDDDIVNKKN